MFKYRAVIPTKAKKIYLILAFFLAILWLAGGKKGLNSAIGLVFTFVCIIWIFLPLITSRVFYAKKSAKQVS